MVTACSIYRCLLIVFFSRESHSNSRLTPRAHSVMENFKTFNSICQEQVGFTTYITISIFTSVRPYSGIRPRMLSHFQSCSLSQYTVVSSSYYPNSQLTPWAQNFKMFNSISQEQIGFKTYKTILTFTSVRPYSSICPSILSLFILLIGNSLLVLLLSPHCIFF